MTIAEYNLATARAAYDTATRVYWYERDRGTIVPLDRTVIAEDEAWKAGQRWKCLTPEARMAMGHWQKAKAELDHAQVAVTMERGFVGCPICPGVDEKPHRLPAPEPDRRLPPERDIVRELAEAKDIDRKETANGQR